MKSLKGTQTEKNILTAFAGESQARNRYTFFASQAKKDGYVEMAKAFEEIASQEKEHAKRLFKFLEGGNVEITASFPAGVIGTTLDNLKAAAHGEFEEHSDMYHLCRYCRRRRLPRHRRCDAQYRHCRNGTRTPLPRFR